MSVSLMETTGPTPDALQPELTDVMGTPKHTARTDNP